MTSRCLTEATGGFTSEFPSLWPGCLHSEIERADVGFWPRSLVDCLRGLVICFMKAALLLDLPQGHSPSLFSFSGSVGLAPGYSLMYINMPKASLLSPRADCQLE